MPRQVRSLARLLIHPLPYRQVFEVSPASEASSAAHAHAAPTEYIWCGNQWNSGLSESPPGPRQHDLLYWTKLHFNANGTVQQVEYSKTCEFEI